MYIVIKLVIFQREIAVLISHGLLLLCELIAVNSTRFCQIFYKLIWVVKPEEVYPRYLVSAWQIMYHRWLVVVEHELFSLLDYSTRVYS